MPEAVFEIVSPSAVFERLPIEIRQRTSKVSAILLALLMLPVVAAVMVPFALVAAHATQEPAIVAKIWANPLTAIQIMAGVLLWAVVIILPLKTLLTRLGRDRTIRLTDGQVTVQEQQMLVKRQWALPISDFDGVAHHVRATLSGTRHELILVHRDKNKCLLLHTSDAILQDTIDRSCQLLALPQLSPKRLQFSFNRKGKRDDNQDAPQPIAA